MQWSCRCCCCCCWCYCISAYSYLVPVQFHSIITRAYNWTDEKMRIWYHWNWRGTIIHISMHSLTTFNRHSSHTHTCMQTRIHARMHALNPSRKIKVIRCEHFSILVAFRDLKFNTLIKSKHSRKMFSILDDPLTIVCDPYGCVCCLMVLCALNPNAFVYFHFYQCMTISWAIKINSRNGFNYQSKVNQTKPILLCVRSISISTFSSLYVIRFSMVCQMFDAMSFVILSENAHLLKIKTIRSLFLVNTLKQKAVATIITFSWVIKLSNGE